MDGRYFQGEEINFSRADIDVMLPALENSTKKKFNNSFSAEQRKYENLERQIQRERKDVSQRLMLERKDFMRSNLILKERMKLSSRRTSTKTETLVEKPVVEEKGHPAERRQKQSTVYTEEKTELPRSPYYFPPLYKNVEKGLREIHTSQAQMDLAKKEPVNTETIKNCRYLRLSSAQERQLQSNNSVLESDAEESLPAVDGFFNGNRPC